MNQGSRQPRIIVACLNITSYFECFHFLGLRKESLYFFKRKVQLDAARLKHNNSICMETKWNISQKKSESKPVEPALFWLFMKTGTTSIPMWVHVKSVKTNEKAANMFVSLNIMTMT
jgi:hypothetical protein